LTRYLSLAEVLRLHGRIIAETGGSEGLRDFGPLESALAQPRQTFGGQDLSLTLVERAAAASFPLIKNHPFVDSNKRIGHAVVQAMLIFNARHQGVPRRSHNIRGPMSADVSVETLQAFADAWNRHDVDALMSFMSDDCVFEASAGPDVAGTRYVGWESVRNGYMEVFATFPDAHWGNARHFVVGDRGVSEWTFTGTRTDGSRVETNGCDLFLFRDGQIAVKNSYRKNRPPFAAEVAK